MKIGASLIIIIDIMLANIHDVKHCSLCFTWIISLNPQYVDIIIPILMKKMLTPSLTEQGFKNQVFDREVHILTTELYNFPC